VGFHASSFSALVAFKVGRGLAFDLLADVEATFELVRHRVRRCDRIGFPMNGTGVPMQFDSREKPLHLRLAGWAIGSIRRMRSAGVVALVAALVACGSVEGPNPADILGLPAPIVREPVAIAPEALAHRGEIVSIDDAAQYGPDIVAAAGSVKRAVYRSTSGVTGQPTEVAGVFAVPKGAPPDGGWPVVSIGHGTTGVGHGCGPSLQPDLMGYQSTLTGLLSTGFAVAMSDYEGLDDVGAHAYLQPRSAAYNVIDAARAAGRLFPEVSAKWAAVGASQGGHAVWAASELNSEYGENLQLVGTVAIAPPSNIAAVAELAFRRELTREQRSALPLVVVGMQRAGLLSSSAPYLRGPAAPTEPDILGCGQVATWKRSMLSGEDVGPDSVEAAEALQRALREVALPQRPLSAPLLVINGTRDDVVLPQWVAYSVHLACKLGGHVHHVELSQAGHSGEFPYGDIEQWLSDRFADEPTESNCGE
jgi:hypothetical protein